MSDSNALDRQRIAQITERIGETFDFARDVLTDPSILEEIPDGVEIELRTVSIHEQIYHIVAYRSENEPECWIARTTERTNLGKVRDRHFWVSIRLRSGVSAEAAMDSVESALRAAEESDQVSHRIA
ncbi:MAG: hypothetical protein M3Q50_01460 [Chloroflexota bacterium]|nr:hypothetical protein [Chloroflexota bacterium]